MPITNHQKNKSRFWNSATKIKHLMNLAGRAQGILIPSSWVDALEWTKETNIVMSVLPYEKKVILQELNNPEDFELNEKVSSAEPVFD